MKLKMILIMFLFLVISSFSTASAEVWYPITGSSGNSQEIELDTIEIVDNLVTYNCRKFDKNYTYITKMRINLANKTFAIVNMKALLNDKQKSFKDNSKNIQYVPIKEGSLAESVYNMMIIAKESPALDVKMKVWQKYFRKQQRMIQKNWHPNFNTLSVSSKPSRSIAYMTLVIDKNGNIVSKQYQSNPNQYDSSLASFYKDFDKWLEAKINNIFVKYPKFDPLPYEYKGKNIIVVLKFEYSEQHDAKTSDISWEETGIGYLENGKNTCGWITFGKVIYSFAALPVAIPSALFFGKNIYAWF